MYCAVIGDIVKSKMIDRRNEAQINLKYVLQEVNNEYAVDIASGFTITLGDEFQGVLKSPKFVLDIINQINFAMHPVKIRYGIGFGDIRTDMYASVALGADGPAYYNARDAVNNLKQTEKKYEMARQLRYLKAEYNTPQVNLVNACFALCDQIENDWTSRQREIIKLMQKHSENQSEAAKELDINKSSVQKSLSASKYYNYTNALNSIKLSMNDIWENQNDN